MKLVFVFLFAVIASVLARPQSGQNPEANAEVLDNYLDNIGIGEYSYGYKTSNGIEGQESGKLQGSGENEGMEVQGSYSYPSSDGKLVKVTYTAGAGGFAPNFSLSR